MNEKTAIFFQLSFVEFAAIQNPYRMLRYQFTVIISYFLYENLLMIKYTEARPLNLFQFLSIWW